jgi:hypothetical protein
MKTAHSDIQYEFTVPIKTVPESNRSSEHFIVKSKRHRTQQLQMWAALHNKNLDVQLPCRIKLTRIAPRKLDKAENLPMSMKWVTDSIADYIFPGQAAGRADDTTDIEFFFDQEKGDPKEYAIRVTIYQRKECCCPCHRQSQNEGIMLC